LTLIWHIFVIGFFELLVFRGIASGDPFGGGLNQIPRLPPFVIFFFKRLQKLRF